MDTNVSDSLRPNLLYCRWLALDVLFSNIPLSLKLEIYNTFKPYTDSPSKHFGTYSVHFYQYIASGPLTPSSITDSMLAAMALTVANKEDIAHLDNLLSTFSTHKIFKRANFDKTIRYDEILPALRLASQRLRMQKTFSHFYMLLSNRAATTKTNGSNEYLELPEPPVGADLRRFVKDRHVVGLSRMVTFSAERFEDQQTRGKTIRMTSLANPPASTLLEGYCSQIVISTSLLDAVYATRSAARNGEGKDSISLLPVFNVAQIPVHELAHAAFNASRTPLDRRQQAVVISGCVTSEEGFEVTAAQFKGLFSLQRARNLEALEMVDAKFNIMVLSERPTNGYQTTYASRSPKAFDLESATSSHYVYIAEDDWTSKVFEDSVWNGGYPKDLIYGPLGYWVGPFLRNSEGKVALASVTNGRPELDLCRSFDRICQQSLYYKRDDGSIYHKSNTTIWEKVRSSNEYPSFPHIEAQIGTCFERLERVVERRCMARNMGLGVSEERWKWYLGVIKAEHEWWVERRARSHPGWPDEYSSDEYSYYGDSDSESDSKSSGVSVHSDGDAESLV